MIPPKDQKERFGLAYLASGAAITFLLPMSRFHGRHLWIYVAGYALVPATIAWLLVRNSPARQGSVVFAAATLAIALVGAGGLALHAVSSQTSAWIEEAVKSPGFTTWAGAYLAIGLLGVIGSMLIGRLDHHQ
jgi:hypothetical protein